MQSFGKKNAEIKADFGHNGKGMANRGLPLDYLRPIGLYNSRDGVLTVVLWPFVIPLKNVEISADFGYYCTTSKDMVNRRLPLDSPRLIGLYTSRNGVLTVVLLPFVVG